MARGAMKRVVIVGAGIGGLAAADHLRRLAAQRGSLVEIVVLEASGHAGGVLATELCEGALLERGPDTLVTHKPAGLALCEELGLGDRLVFPPPGQIDILEGGRLVPLPAGFTMPGASPPAPTREGVDESVAAHLRRRLGAEPYERWAEPVIGGIFMADCEELSSAATFPRAAAKEGSGAPAPVATLAGGLGQIAGALVARLPPGALRLGCAVERLIREPQGFVLKLAGGNTLTADAVLLALPAHAAAALLSDLDPHLARELARIPYASCVTVNLAWPRAAVERLPESHGFFVPRTAGVPVVAATFVSVKYPERVAADQLVVRVFLGGALHPEAIDRSDAELVELSTAVLAPLLGLREPPAWNRTWRHSLAMPQRTAGHPARVERLRTRLADHPSLDFAGGPLGGYGLPDSIAAGEAAAERLLGP